ncbi:MAG: hypothetical protein ACOYOK_06820 [Pseudobdellovibrionaceae bacterium]
MSKDNTSAKPAKKETAQIPNNVIQLGTAKCLADDCKKTGLRAGFCKEHFDWFKEGLITKEGHKAVDFDKKYQHFVAAASAHKKAA